ncbi:hypothetical protein, partial [Aeromonas salmonicida]|uniref:hypothetical protein n=1 Tax=Aeromonas salmonicida TaxID=645 RepID=UPI003D30FBCB
MTRADDSQGAGGACAMRQLPLTIHGGRTTLVWVQRLGAGLTTRVIPLYAHNKTKMKPMTERLGP